MVETVAALQAIGRVAAQWGVANGRWWLNRPVYNRGRLRNMLPQLRS